MELPKFFESLRGEVEKGDKGVEREGKESRGESMNKIENGE